MSFPTADHHARHDPLLVVAATTDAQPSVEPTPGLDWIATCPACAALADDVRTLAVATAAVQPVRRPRDFFLQPDDAVRLRRRGLRGLVGALTRPAVDLGRPVAAALTALGLAGLLLATVPGVPGGSIARPSAADPAPNELRAQGSGDVTYDASGHGGGAIDGGRTNAFTPAVPAASAGASAAAGSGSEAGPTAKAAPRAADGRGSTETPIDARGAPRDPGAASPLTVLSGTFLIVGLGLFGLHWSARRFGG